METLRTRLDKFKKITHLMKPIFNFSIKIIFLIAIAFIIHLTILYNINSLLFSNEIVLSYSVNTGLAIAIFIALYKLKEKFSRQIGFLFMAGSALKFIVFFIVFRPIYKADGVINSLEFAAFFIPYFLCLIIETYTLSKWLNKMQ